MIIIIIIKIGSQGITGVTSIDIHVSRNCKITLVNMFMMLNGKMFDLHIELKLDISASQS